MLTNFHYALLLQLTSAERLGPAWLSFSTFMSSNRQDGKNLKCHFTHGCSIR